MSTGGTGAVVAAGEGHVTGYGTPAYRNYVLTILLLIYILNFVDRSLLSVVARPLKAELGIDDTAFGLLTGFGFAVLYTLVGLPIARAAETRNRVWIITVCVALWSVMTALCGLSREVVIGSVTIGAFWVLLACRVGVGIGEAGCTPPANSLIADYFPPLQRATALGYYAMGVTLGTAVSNLVGGIVTDMFDWRTAFFVVGLPGVAVAFLLRFTVKEPPRGFTDPPGTVKADRTELKVALRELMSRKSYWHMTVAATIAAFCGYGIISFQSLYLQRTFHLSAGEAAMINTVASVAAAAGTFLMGWLADRLVKRDVTAIAWLPAIGLLISAPLYWWSFTTTSLAACVFSLAAGGFVKYGYLAAQYTIGQGVVSLRVRATATAVLLFVVNLLGYGFGPLAAGWVSDTFFRKSLAEAGYAGVVDRGMCDAAQEALNVAERAGGTVDVAGVIAALKRPIDVAQLDFCNAANASSTQAAMLAIASIYVFAGLFFLTCARHYRRDLASVTG